MNVGQIRRRRETVETIHAVTHALRAVAAGRIQSAQRAAAAAERYHDILVRSLAAIPVGIVASSAHSRQEKKILLLVLTSEQPLCGALSQNVVEMAERRWRELQGSMPVVLMVVGRRGVRQFTVRGMVPDLMESGTTSLAGLRDVVKRIAGVLATQYSGDKVGEVRVIYSRYVSVSEQVPTEERILPPDISSLRQSALREGRDYAHYTASEDLLTSLVAEYAFIALYRIAAEMFISEQAARLVAMDGASRSAKRMLDALRAQESHARQEQVTAQVLELIGARFSADSERSA